MCLCACVKRADLSSSHGRCFIVQLQFFLNLNASLFSQVFHRSNNYSEKVPTLLYWAWCPANCQSQYTILVRYYFPVHTPFNPLKLSSASSPLTQTKLHFLLSGLHNNINAFSFIRLMHSAFNIQPNYCQWISQTTANGGIPHLSTWATSKKVRLSKE